MHKKYEAGWTSVEVTLCKNIHTNGKPVELRKILACVSKRRDNFGMLNQLWGAEGDEELRTEIKKSLPVWVPGGVFEGRKDLAHRKSFSNIICIDIDGKDNPGKSPEEIKESLSRWCNDDGEPYVGYAGLSCSRKGVFALVRLPNKAILPEEYKLYYNAIEDEIAHLYGIVIDKASANPVQQRFIAYDENPVFNYYPAVWEKQMERVSAVGQERLSPKKPIKTNGRWRASLSETMDYIVEYARLSNDPIFYTEQEWWQCCIALISTFGEQGRWWFADLSDIWSRVTGQKHKISPHSFYTAQMKKGYHGNIGFIISRADAAGAFR